MIQGVEGGACVRIPAGEVGDTAARGEVVAPGDAGDRPSFRSALLSLRQAERDTDQWLKRAFTRGIADPQELLRLQVVVQRFQYQVELASRLVEQVSQGVRTLTHPTG